MSHLSVQTLQKLKGMLDQRERELTVDVRREEDQKDPFRDIASETSDPGDQSFADLTTDLDNAAIGRDVVELRAIQRAHAHMDNDTYGVCVDCGEPIPEERLMAQPTAERCARDQEAWEKGHPGAGRGATL
jgi:RNA polymerase-binding transcription factor DksA